MIELTIIEKAVLELIPKGLERKISIQRIPKKYQAESYLPFQIQLKKL